MTISREQFSQVVNETGIFKGEYALDVLTRLAHHSAAIEGNTLTLSDSISLIVEDKTPSTSKPLRELYEVANHRDAFAEILLMISDNRDLNIEDIKQIQYDLMDHIRPDAGEFKTNENMILGANFLPTHPSLVPTEISQWVDNYNYQLKELSKSDLLYAIAEKHIEFEMIHPFADGNGRTGRMLINYATIKAFGSPVVISNNLRDDYINILQRQDPKGLFELFTQSIGEEINRMKKFDNSNNTEQNPNLSNQKGRSL